MTNPTSPAWLALVAGMAASAPTAAQTIPFSDTEDATLGDVSVGPGRLHALGRLNVRNGDYARGGYDDDSASIDRVPAHVELGLVYDLTGGARGLPEMWLELHSSNGLHAPADDERASPRGWYETNNLVGLVVAPVRGLRAALSYTIKHSPNGVAATSHETSVALSFESEKGLGWLHPNAVATVRPKGGHGLFTQAGIEPSWALDAAAHGPSLSVPVSIGIGWQGFYAPGTGTVRYESIGFAYTSPFTLGTTQWALRGEMTALVRDRTLARLDGDAASGARVVPVGQLTLSVAY